MTEKAVTLIMSRMPKDMRKAAEEVRDQIVCC
jgi:hypothetical protein